MIKLKKLSSEVQFHLLRHFYEVPKAYIIKLSKLMNLSPEILYQQLEVPGSKFNREFAAHPLALLSRIKQADSTQWETKYEDEDKTDCIIVFSKDKWPNGIGSNRLIHIDDVKSDELSNIVLKQREHFLIKTLIRKEFPESNQLVLIIDKQYNVVSAFPGQWLPPLSKDVANDYIFLTTSQN